MELKIRDVEFLGDTVNLFRPELLYDPNIAYEFVKKQLIDKLC